MTLPLPVANLRLTEAEAAPAFPAATPLDSPSSPPRHVPLADAPRLALSVQMVRWIIQALASRCPQTPANAQTPDNHVSLTTVHKSGQLH
jgi:hypothetical protein